ncbi:hypothetical protein AVEN_128749-1 [Araneus ventricosus]|uniref:EGF-like domain-containing protein n=1 Tax=Araneus ventricosus TaxID=182803 RepID=A0A4Y2IYK3_ARAVE|nr:hypothetical protein AVEN_128749-1 [Araneus ventricosus]
MLPPTSLQAIKLSTEWSYNSLSPRPQCPNPTIPEGKHCYNNDDCQYPLKCEYLKDERRRVCTRKQCTSDEDCAYPLSCVDKGFNEGKVCAQKECNNDTDCQYPLKCTKPGYWLVKVCSECDCGKEFVMGLYLKDIMCSFYIQWTKCIECDCGPHGSCSFESGQKKCVCSPYSIEKDGKCIACYCGESTKSCHFDSSGDKNCSCLSGYAPVDGNCVECNCGPYGTCSFEYGQKKCDCRSFAVEMNGVCVEVGTTSSEETTHSIELSTIISSTVQECDCGPRGRCKFEFGHRKCICDPLTSEMDGICIDCDCGKNSKFCHFNWKGDKQCNCTSGYAQVHGFCHECNCGVNAQSCSYRRNGTKVCNCEFGYIQINGHCSAICSEDKCVHGECETFGNSFKCRCNEGFTGRRCEEKIQVKSNKQDLLLILQLSVALATFILLSGVLCFLLRIVNRISKK